MRLRSDVGKRRGSSHKQTFFVSSPTSGPTDSSILSGLMVAKDEKLPPKPKINTNANQKNGGGTMYFKPRTSVFYGK
jgi:hypothetical protein